jgi:hypothetical protein
MRTAARGVRQIWFLIRCEILRRQLLLEQLEVEVQWLRSVSA